MTGKANCLRCGAKCAVHALKCEAEAMNGREAIDCKTFIPAATPDEDKQEILTVMRGVRKNLESLGWADGKGR